MTKFKTLWQKKYGSIPPLGYILRQQVPDRWFRIHSLPESKRYPENPAEYEILLERQNTIANEVLGLFNLCWLIVTTYGINDQHEFTSLIPGVGPLVNGFSSGPSVEYDIDCPVSFWQTRLQWQTGKYDELIRKVANYELPQLLFASDDMTRIYAPYDGGADLILETEHERNALRGKYAAWLSTHPSGC